MKKLLYLLLSVLACLSACHPAPYPPALARAEYCLMNCPDSTLHYISLLEDSLSSLPQEARMYCQLLKVGAEDKLYIKHNSDSLMLNIVRFYEDYENSEKLMLAYYYLGSTYRDMNDAPRAISYYQKATEIGKDIPEQHTLLSIIYGQIGTLLAYQGVYDESLMATRKALNICKEYGDSIRYPYLLRNVARIWKAKENKDSTLFYYHIAYQQAIQNKDSHKENVILGELGAVYYSLGEREKAKNILSRPIQKKYISEVELLCLGEIYYSENQLDSATYYLIEALNSGRILQKAEACKHLAKIKEQQGNLAGALNYYNQATIYFDSIWNTTATEAVAKVNALYHYQHTEHQNLQLQQENHQKQVTIYQVSLALVACIIVYIFRIHHLRRKKETAILQEKKLRQQEEEKYRQSKVYIENNNKRLIELDEQLQQAVKESDLYKQQFLSTQKELLELTNRQAILLQNRNELQKEHLEASPIYIFFHQDDRSNIEAAGDEEWKQLQNTVDTLYDGFTEKLYTLCPSISKIELRICYLTKIKVQPTTIANILKRGTSAISMAKARLYEKLHGGKGTAPLFDNFIGSL